MGNVRSLDERSINEEKIITKECQSDFTVNPHLNICTWEDAK